MQLVTFKYQDRTRLGARVGDSILDLLRVCPDLPNPLPDIVSQYEHYT